MASAFGNLQSSVGSFPKLGQEPRSETLEESAMMESDITLVSYAKGRRKW